MGNFGFSEILLIFLAFLILFGAKKLPEFAKSLGKSLREFKKATSDIQEEIESASTVVQKPIETKKVDSVKETPKETTSGKSDQPEILG
ncbi:MAG: twin-arginine translocase TatA/TatE family subunit [Candidatus Marinimicrobia bacterium]|jgi:sec-independent protein translocase protein TatA|nr:twin-arginine translocase TatA/TatE family subunit [Candidatus Neomarinimicrobiota bacterium]